MSGYLFGQLKYFNYTFVPDIPDSHFIILSLIGGIAAVFGDLIESFFKRVANIKDSSNYFPGHGGMLDRVFFIITSDNNCI